MVPKAEFEPARVSPPPPQDGVACTTPSAGECGNPNISNPRGSAASPTAKRRLALPPDGPGSRRATLPEEVPSGKREPRGECGSRRSRGSPRSISLSPPRISPRRRFRACSRTTLPRGRARAPRRKSSRLRARFARWGPSVPHRGCTVPSPRRRSMRGILPGSFPPLPRARRSRPRGAPGDPDPATREGEESPEGGRGGRAAIEPSAGLFPCADGDRKKGGIAFSRRPW